MVRKGKVRRASCSTCATAQARLPRSKSSCDLWLSKERENGCIPFFPYSAGKGRTEWMLRAKSITRSGSNGMTQLCLAFAVIVLCFVFVVRIVTVDGHSMELTLLSGQRGCAKRLLSPAARDVVVVDSYSRYGDMLVKRVVGVGGDVIDIDFEAGWWYRNGQALTNPMCWALLRFAYDIQFPVTVPQGSVFLLGDNRNGSKDSRSSEIGYIDERDLLGKVLWRLTPFSQMGKVT